MRTGNVLLLLFVLSVTWSTSTPVALHAQQRTLGPVLKIHTDPFLFDTVRCRVRRCIPISFENIGDTVLVLHNHDRLRRPFYVRIDTPLVLQPGEMQTFDLCYNPFEYSKDSQYVSLRADTRLPLSLAMVHDVSASMYTLLPDGKRRYEAAHDASTEFIGNLLDTLGIEDEGAIYTYAYYQEFALEQTWTRDTAALRAAIPGRPLGTATCTYDALSRVIDSISTRDKMRVIIILTDGEDSGEVTCGTASVLSVIKKARDNNVRIYAITIGNIDRAPLIQIVKATDGKEFNATKATDLLAIYREIAVDMSKNVSLSIFTKAEAVGPKIEFTPSTWEFDSVQVGETACQEVLVRNSGSSWLLADSVRSVFSPPYSLVGLDVDSIAPYQTLPAQVCFTPLLPLHYDSPIPYFPSPCENYEDTLLVKGNSFLLPRVPRKVPLLTIGDISSDFDTTFCQTTECIAIDLHNGSDTTVTVHAMDTVRAPFTATTAAPFTIDPGESESVVICYHPPDAPRRDTLRLTFTADARVPQQIALLFDRSQAMQTAFMPGLDRMLTASAGANDFIDGLEFGAAFSDVVSIASFDSAGAFSWNGQRVSDRDSLRSILPDSAGQRVACVFGAVSATLDAFEGADSKPRSILLFTAGEDAGNALCGPSTAVAVATRALALGTRIHCVQLGDADSTDLAQLALGTGGRYLRPATLLDLILGLRDIEESLSQNVRFERTVIVRGVTPILAVEEDTLDFGSTEFSSGDPALRRVTRATNIGDAPMHLQKSAVASPFSIAGSPAGLRATDEPAINPGESVLLEYAFEPRMPGEFIDTLWLTHDGCGQDPVSVLLHARAVAAFYQEWQYPLAVQSPPPLQFDTMSCGAEQCLDIVFAASHTAGTKVGFPRPLRMPFYSVLLGDSLQLGAGDTHTAAICYHPDASGVHEQWLVFDSETRPLLSTVFVLPSDHSALDTLAEGLAFRDLSLAARGLYARWIMEDATFNDEAAIITFDAAGRATELPFSASPYDIRNADPAVSASPVGDLSAALNAAMDYAGSNAKGKKIVVAAINDAAAMSAADAASLRDRAMQENVILAIAAVGPSGYSVLAPTATGAIRFDSCFTLSALQRFIYETTRMAVEVKRDSVLLTGAATAAKMDVHPLVMDFDTLRVGTLACQSLTVENSGNAPLVILDIINPNGPTPTGLPLEVAAHQQVELEVCHRQTQLREQGAELLVVYDGCGLDTIRIQTAAWGTDTLTVGVEGVVRGMPGSVVRFPVLLAGNVPSAYDVRSFAVTLAFDKTMLYPLNENVAGEGSITSTWSKDTVKLTWGWRDDNPRATAKYTIYGKSPLRMDGSSGVLLSPPFLVLHGDAMETNVLVTEAFFGDGLPAAVIGSFGTFIADSLGFHQRRLIDPSDRYHASIIGTYPNPFNSSVTIAYALRKEAPVRLSVHDALGREVRVLDSGRRDAGVHRVRFEAAGLPTGVYFYRLESDGILLSGSMLYMK